VVATNVILASGGMRLSAVGGSGGYRSTIKYGGNGGGGRIRLEATNIQGLAYASAGTGTLSTAALSTQFIAAGSGSYTSAIANIGNVNGSIAHPGVWGTINFNEAVPAGTTLDLYVHSCALSDCSDRGASDWSVPVNGQDLSSLAFVDDAHAYIQYKVDMSTTGGALPRLYDLTINANSYGTDVWYQTDDSIQSTGFNIAGATNTNMLIVGSGDAAALYPAGTAIGTGADGTFDSGTYDGSSIAGITGVWPNLTIDTDEISHAGSFNFSTFIVRQGHNVRVKGSNPLKLNVLGDMTIQGALNANGFNGGDGTYLGAGGPGGGTGGAGCATGGGLGGGGGVAYAGSSAPGGGGVGHASAGTVGGTSYSVTGGAVGLTYGDPALPSLEGGSGGGGSTVISGGCSHGVHGGGGGGAVQIYSGGTVTVGTVGLISVDGGNGAGMYKSSPWSGGGGGGGSAGSLEVMADQIVLNNPGASLSARGGLGGTSYYFADGGNGGDGRIELEATTMPGTTSINVCGGSVVASGLPSMTPVSSSYTSAIHDMGAAVNWDTVSWVESVLSGTTQTISLRSCSLADCSDRGASDWSQATNNQDISALAFVADNQQYIQYKVDQTSDGVHVPRLDGITINVTLHEGS